MDLASSDLGGGRMALRFAGRIGLGDAARLHERATALLRARPREVELDLSGVEQLEGNGAALLLGLQAELTRRGARVVVHGARPAVADLLALYQDRRPVHPGAAARAAPGFVEAVGRSVLGVVHGTRGALDYLGGGMLAFAAAVRRPRSVNWADVPRLMERAGADALPIVVLMNFLMGVVTAFQAAVQLRRFGADIFVANLVALSVTRELGPLMTSIVAAGRSGSAFSAELGTMAVSEEVDALRTLGLCPYRFLVFPRVLALVLVVPLLVVVANAVAMAGGLVVAVTALDLTPAAYLSQMRRAVQPWDAGSGLLKSVFFALAIALIACQRGLATRGGAEGVGRATTSAVVSGLLALVVLDALFTILFDVFKR